MKLALQWEALALDLKKMGATLEDMEPLVDGLVEEQGFDRERASELVVKCFQLAGIITPEQMEWALRKLADD